MHGYCICSGAALNNYFPIELAFHQDMLVENPLSAYMILTANYITLRNFQKVQIDNRLL